MGLLTISYLGIVRGQVTQIWNFGTPPYLRNGRRKIRSIGVTRGSRNPIFLEFWDPLLISARVEARNTKFDMKMDPEGN